MKKCVSVVFAVKNVCQQCSLPREEASMQAAAPIYQGWTVTHLRTPVVGVVMQPTGDEELLPIATIDEELWQLWNDASRSHHCADGVPNICRYQAVTWYDPVALFTPCICCSVCSRRTNPYEDRPLPAFAMEGALVVTRSGLQGYRRPLTPQCNDPPWCHRDCCCYCFRSERYVRGSSWEPVTLAWDDVGEIKIFHADQRPCGTCVCCPVCNGMNLPGI